MLRTHTATAHNKNKRQMLLFNGFQTPNNKLHKNCSLLYLFYEF